MGDSPPEQVLAKPELFEGLVEVWRAFWFLDSRRTFNDGGIPSAIAMSEIKAYLEFFGSDFVFFDMKSKREKEEFLFYFSAMDDEAMSHMIEKVKESQEQNK